MEKTSNAVESWTCADVGDWLQEIGFDKYKELFSSVHKIDGKVLLSLTETDLRHPPLQLKVLGDIKRLAQHIQHLQSLCVKSELEPTIEHSAGVHLGGKGKDRRIYTTSSVLRHRPSLKEDSGPFDNVDGVVENRLHHMKSPDANSSAEIPPEIWKTVLSFFYVFAVFMLTAFVMVVVHDRVPEMDKYPPLPDLFLDNMPYVPWAFEACEIVGLMLAFMWFTMLLFHRHRFVLMRRMFSLMGTIFLLRCVTMLITSLSVPGKHLKCSGKRYGDWYSRFYRTFEIWKGMGMSLQGVRSCGDYMFSGHTSIITLLNFFITEYTPRKYYYVHIISWVLNFFGIFFLLAAHEHYSIDVFMAFYLSSRLFMYYHTLANNRALMAPDARRTRVWFPLFAFFESKCEGRVPNQFEYPLGGIVLCFNSLTKWTLSSCGTVNQNMPHVPKRVYAGATSDVSAEIQQQ